MPEISAAPGELVLELLRRALPGPPTILDLRCADDTSRETWTFDTLDTTGNRHPLALRRNRARTPDMLVGRADALTATGEYALLRYLHARGIPVPRPVAASGSPAEAELDCDQRAPGSDSDRRTTAIKPGSDNEPSTATTRPGSDSIPSTAADGPGIDGDPAQAAPSGEQRGTARHTDSSREAAASSACDRNIDDYYIAERVEGEARPAALVHDPRFDTVRPHLVRQLGATLARIHSGTAADLRFLPHRSPTAQLDLVRDLLDIGGAPRPALEAGLRWCRDRLPQLGARPIRLVHGDFRIGNFAVGPDGLRAVLHWDHAHLGDPALDLANACLRIRRGGADDRECGGLGTRHDFLSAYQAAGGPPIDEPAIHFAEVLTSLRTAGVFLSRTIDFRFGTDHSLDAAADGRRIAEIEYDLLALLDREP
ncbi:phosphotransferase family protein [Nocardia sp. NPDC127579]|uniref:phosphotransferase family protein n=1 Tax=Nocardia sp. NPDC127579 TaxID=3345402 RepID=UPI0036334D75